MIEVRCGDCLRVMKTAPLYRNRRGWLVCFDCLTNQELPAVTVVPFGEVMNDGVVGGRAPSVDDGAVGG